MEIFAVQDALRSSQDKSKHVRLEALVALEPAPAPYYALLLQPHGTIHASAQRIGNSDPASILPMYRAFLDHALQTQAQLVVTPEYSAPWSLVEQILSSTVRPPKGALWAMGCESITLDELDALRVRTDAMADVRLFHEPLDPTKRAQARFIDPLVYVFWGLSAADTDVLCVLVQFKTLASRDEDNIELASLYRGTRVYKFSHTPDGISLIGLICSEAFSFSAALVDAHHRDLLLLHIQLNKRPGHADYAAYRQHLYSIGSRSNVEVLCLNWAAGIYAEGDTTRPWSTISNSAWYIGPDKCEVDDKVVNSLHQHGVYYSLVGQRWHAFYLNYSAHAILLRKQPVFVKGPQVLVRQLAPQVVDRRIWIEDAGAWSKGEANDGFAAFASDYAPLDSMLPGGCRDPLSVERVFELLYGPSGNAITWFHLDELPAISVATEESLRRVTVSQETNSQREGVAFRRERARRAQVAATLRQLSPPWPPGVADLAQGFRFRWSSSEPHCNVESVVAGRAPATLVYLGENPETDRLQNLRALLEKALRRVAIDRTLVDGGDLSAAAARAVDRLCIVYKANHALTFLRDSAQASIVIPNVDVVDDIAGGTS